MRWPDAVYVRRDKGFGASLAADAGLSAVSDEELMRLTGEADDSAYSELVARHLNWGLGFAERLTGSRADAEEIMQEAFLRVWTTASRWRTEGARFTTWFYRVVMNLCIDRKRKKVPEPLGTADDPADPAPGADRKVFENERNRTVARALTGLPARQRAAIALCYFQGLSNREAAEVLSVSVKAVESLLTRGRKTMYTRLAGKKDEILGAL